MHNKCVPFPDIVWECAGSLAAQVIVTMVLCVHSFHLVTIGLIKPLFTLIHSNLD